MSLKDLKNELYRKTSNLGNRKRKIEKSIEQKNRVDLSSPKIENPWGVVSGTEKNKKGNLGSISTVQKYGRILIISSITALVVMLGFSGYYLYQFFSTRSVDLSANYPSEALVGQKFDIEVNFENSTKKPLLNSTVFLSLPNGVIYVENPDKKIIEQGIVKLNPGEIAKKNFEVAIIGDSNKTYQFNIGSSYVYGEESLSNKFERNTTIKILAKDNVLALDLTTPEKVLSGEDFEMNLKYKNITDSELKNSKIKLELPDGFSINGSDPSLDDDNSIIIDSILPNQENTVVLSGSIIGKEYSFFSIKSIAEINIDSKYYEIVKRENSISISPSPLSIKIERKNGDNAVYPGGYITYNLVYTNNSDIELKDVIVDAKLSGEMVDVRDIKSEGFFNPSSKTIRWTASEIPDFKSLGVNKTGSLSLQVNLLKDYPITSISDKDFTIILDVEISSPTVPANVVANRTIGITSSRNKVGGDIKLQQKLYFNDPGNFVNSGSLPPKVGEPIEYTVYWTLNSKGSDFENINMSAFLGQGVEWTGKVLSNIKEAPTYNQRTKEIQWNVAKVLAGAGVVSEPPIAVFQVRTTPTSNQEGDRLTIINRGSLEAYDSFINKDIGYSVNILDSSDLFDLNPPSQYDKVIPN